MYRASTTTSIRFCDSRSSTLSSCSALVSLSTGRWWNGTPWASARGARSGWLETTSGTSASSSPVSQRQRRSRRIKKVPPSETYWSAERMLPSCIEINEESAEIRPFPSGHETVRRRLGANILGAAPDLGDGRVEEEVEDRSEERRVGKECRSRRSRYH